MTATLTNSASPAEIYRSSKWIRKFPGGKGENNCPSFYYVRDGFGCPFSCSYCYLRRFEFRHPEGAEINPRFDDLYKEVESFLRRPGRLGLILGEVTDAWGWAFKKAIRERNLKLVEMFREQDRHDLIFLSKSHKVNHYLEGIEPHDRVILSWSVNTPSVSSKYEMGIRQAGNRLLDAVRLNNLGWRVRFRIDPMVPIGNWKSEYRNLAEYLVDEAGPELVTLGTWRPRPRDPMVRQAGPALRSILEVGLDGRLRLNNRMEMYRVVLEVLDGRVPVGLCKEDLHIQGALQAEFGVQMESCNCLPITRAGGKSVGDRGGHLKLVRGTTEPPPPFFVGA